MALLVAGLINFLREICIAKASLRIGPAAPRKAAKAKGA
jgi:hypothetical protein